MGIPSAPEADVPAVVRLDMRGAPESLWLVRLLTTALGAEAGFDVDDLDDVRIAVDELASQVVQCLPESGHLAITFSMSPGEVAVAAEGTGHVVPRQPDELLPVILDGLGAEWALVEPCGFTLRMRAGQR